MNVPEQLNFIRQQLHQVKQASGQATRAFGLVEKGSEQAADLLTTISNDMFEAGISNRRWDLGSAARRAEERLGEVVVHHDQVVTDLDTLYDADPTIQEALYQARAQVDSLGLPSNSTWLLRNAIDSAKREEDYATAATDEIDRSLTGMESELSSVLDSAAEVGKRPTHRWGHGYGPGRGGWGRGRRERSCNTWQGQHFRERWQQRLLERRQRARALDESTGKLDNPFRDIDRSAERGARHQAEVVDYVNQALRWVDQIEQEYLTSRAKEPAPRPGATPGRSTPAPARPMPSPTAPVPVFDSPVAPRPTPPAPTPTPAPAPPAGQEPKPEGFFKKRWGSK